MLLPMSGGGQAYSNKGCSDRAIENFNRAIELGDDSARELLEKAHKKGASE